MNSDWIVCSNLTKCPIYSAFSHIKNTIKRIAKRPRRGVMAIKLASFEQLQRNSVCNPHWVPRTFDPSHIKAMLGISSEHLDMVSRRLSLSRSQSYDRVVTSILSGCAIHSALCHINVKLRKSP